MDISAANTNLLDRDSQKPLEPSALPEIPVNGASGASLTGKVGGESPRSEKDIRSGLTARSFTALKWNYAGTAVKAIAQFTFSVVLARMLGPGAFGIYSALLLITTLGSLVVEGGLGSALIQISDLDDDTVRFAFTRLLSRALIVAIVLCAPADVFARIFHFPGLTLAIYGSAVYLIVYACSVVPSALLNRHLDFKLLQIAQIITYILAYSIVGVGGALLGLGPLSLVGALITQLFLFTAAAYMAVPHAIRPLFELPVQKLTPYGSRVMAINLLNWTIENLDNVVIGWRYGVHSLGVYSVSYALVRVPTNNVMITAQTVLFPAGARAQNSLQRLQTAYLATINGVLLVLCPVLFSAALLSRTLVEGIYGSRWAGAEKVLVPLALAMVVHACMTGSTLLWAKGRLGVELRVQRSVALVFCISMVMVSRISVEATAWAVLGLYTLRAAWLTRGILKVLEVPWRLLVRTIKGAFLLGGLIAGSLYLLDRALAESVPAATMRLLVLVSAGIIIAGLAPLMVRNLAFSAELRSVVSNLRLTAPRWVQSVIEVYVGA